MARGSRPGSAITPVLALALTACVAGPSGPSPTDPHGVTTTTGSSTTSTTQPVEQGLENYRSCMSDRGVPVAAIESDGRGRPRMAEALSGLDLSDRSVLSAVESCGRHLSAGALALGSDPELQAAVQRQLENFSECLRLNGVSRFPDPVPSFDGVGSPFPANAVPWTDPDLPEAVEVCTGMLVP